MAEVVNRTGGVEINGQMLFGLDAEVALKMEAKYDYGRERTIMTWIEDALGEKFPSRDFHESLKSGVILCKLLNKIRPGTIKKWNTRSIALMEMENIKLYLEGCWKLGIPSSALFVSSDLYKKRGMNEVLNNLEALSLLAARTKAYTGPVLPYHEKERGGAAAGSGAAARAPPPKKWSTIESKGPRFITDGQASEDIDLRSEIVKLKQLLEREKYDKEFAEAELAKYKASNPSPSGSSSKVGPIVDKSAEIEREYKVKVARLENEIKELEKQLRARSTDDSSSKLRSEVSSLQKQLDQEKTRSKTAEETAKKEKNEANRLLKELQTLKQQPSSGGGSGSVSLNVSSGSGIRSDHSAELERLRNQLQSEQDEKRKLSNRNQNLSDEIEGLKGLIEHLRTDLNFALQIQPPRGEAPGGSSQSLISAGGRKDYFLIEDGSDASKEIQLVEDTLHLILHSRDVDVEFSEVTDLNEFFKVDSGRRKFTQILETALDEAPTSLSQNSFELILYLINTTLTEMDISDSTDLIAAKILMKAATVFKRESDGTYIQNFISSYAVYHDFKFWEELFWDELFRLHKKSARKEDDEHFSMDHKLTLQVLDSLVTTMLQWDSPREEIARFIDYIIIQAKLNEESTNQLYANIKSDSYWESNAKRKLKQAAWIHQKRRGGSTIFKRGFSRNEGLTARKKKGSRIRDAELSTSP